MLATQLIKPRATKQAAAAGGMGCGSENGVKNMCNYAGYGSHLCLVSVLASTWARDGDLIALWAVFSANTSTQEAGKHSFKKNHPFVKHVASVRAVAQGAWHLVIQKSCDHLVTGELCSPQSPRWRKCLRLPQAATEAGLSCIGLVPPANRQPANMPWACLLGKL